MAPRAGRPPSRSPGRPAPSPGLPVATRPAISTPRILLYSHDTYGLGHLRRSLAIAGCLARLPVPPTVLLATGSPTAGAFDLPAGCDTLELPAVTKTADGRYRPRTLDVALAHLVELRSGLLRAAAAAEWSRGSVWDVVENVYDRVFVYGDPAVLTTARRRPPRWWRTPPGPPSSTTSSPASPAGSSSTSPTGGWPGSTSGDPAT